jgi:hypothetical protein
MNRQERRRTAAIERKQTPGYGHRLLAAYAKGNLPSQPGVFFATIQHETWCAIYKGRGCDCVPDISVSGPDDTVTIIDEEGNGTKVKRS